MIADGGFGRVWAATRAADGRAAAVKVLHRELAADPAAIIRFEREAWAMNTIRHPNVVQLYDCGRFDGGVPWLAMELITGTDLRQLIIDQGPQRPACVLELFTPLCSALAAAHAARIIHRDIKPTNVMIELGTERVVLLDFGVAKVLDGTPITGRRRTVGTPSCMAPEQIQGLPVDARTDVYALGLLAFHLLTGRPMFCATSDETAEERYHLYHARPAPSAIADVSQAVDRVILRAVAIDPTLRHQSVAEFIEALAAAINRPVATLAPVAPAVRGSP